MNQAILEKYGFTFIRLPNGDKSISNTATSYIASYISDFTDSEIIDEFIYDIDLCLTGQYDLVDDPSWNNWFFTTARLYPEGLYFGDDKWLPLVDLKELLKSWKEYLEKG